MVPLSQTGQTGRVTGYWGQRRIKMNTEKEESYRRKPRKNERELEIYALLSSEMRKKASYLWIKYSMLQKRNNQW